LRLVRTALLLAAFASSIAVLVWKVGAATSVNAFAGAFVAVGLFTLLIGLSGPRGGGRSVEPLGFRNAWITVRGDVEDDSPAALTPFGVLALSGIALSVVGGAVALWF
jgi:hypothetical protein